MSGTYGSAPTVPATNGEYWLVDQMLPLVSARLNRPGHRRRTKARGLPTFLPRRFSFWVDHYA